ncbi:TetR/AcrR family transcriptional regulator [Lactobacillus sp. YT155]|uniref:TetR/AcrR family transcriptional regulator n=1 Tax=Lactobacillus sp. YT155 TaxID=3060955 RepID=UPI00265ED305|nr:TetR/AcrR family transcriptional regulator [Lactobacillus sp. YT155]MDO1604509.1 TetR/AcrR family transcriptional regulator [Lactobacillus sp. YT155]
MPVLTKNIIMNVAEELVIKNHSTNIRIEQISSELAVTHAAIYKHFKNRHDLWLSVSIRWFHKSILKNITLKTAYSTPEEELHDWLWQFVTAKKKASSNQPEMFELHMIYLDNHPDELQKVLAPCYEYIDLLLNYRDNDYERAKAIMSCFSVFTLPAFKETWFQPDYQQRFENIWNLIKKGLN